MSLLAAFRNSFRTQALHLLAVCSVMCSVMCCALLLPEISAASNALGFGPTTKVGHVFARGIVLGENGQPVFAEFDEEGQLVREIGEAFGDLEGAKIMSTNDYRFHHGAYLDFNNEFQQTKARGARLLTREEYLSQEFGPVEIPNLADPDAGPRSVDVFKPQMPEGINSILVRSNDTIVTEQIARQELVLFTSPIDLRAASSQLGSNNQFGDTELKSLLLNEAGRIIDRSRVDIGLRTAYWEREDGDIGDLSKDDSTRSQPGDTPVAPIANALVYPDMQWNSTSLTDENGQFSLYYFLPPCPGFSWWFDYNIIGEIPYRNFNPKSREWQPWSVYYTRVPVSDYCEGFAVNFQAATNLQEQSIYSSLVGIAATRANPIVLADMPVVSHMLTGQGTITNTGQEPVALGERTTYSVEASSQELGAPRNLDLNGDRIPDDLRIADNGELEVRFNPNSEDPDLTRVPDQIPDFSDQGLLETLSADDLAETDLYVYRQGNGQLLVDREGLRADEYEIYNAFCSEADPDCSATGEDPKNQFYYKILVRGRWFYDYLAGGLTDYQSKTGINEELQGLDANHLRAGEGLKVIAINRKTGYIGTATVTVQAAGTENGALSFDIPPLLLTPPNLKVQAKRSYEIEAGLTAGEVKEYTVGAEGAGLVSDNYIVITTEWADRDGSPLPEDLPGYTGRLAHVIDSNELGALNGSLSQFAIRPGRRTQVIRLPSGSALDREHYYVHVNGESIDGNPSFARNQGAGEGPLAYRPDYYVPIRVPLLDEFATIERRNQLRYAQQDGLTELTDDDIDPVYRWHYRPEMQFTVSEFDAPAIQYPGNDDVQTIDLTQTQSLDALGQLDLASFVYSLFQNPNSPLPEIGGNHDLVLKLGGEEQTVTIGPDQTLQFDDLNSLQQLDTADFLTLQLYQNSDPNNVLWEYAFEKPALTTSFSRTTSLGSFNAAQSTDGLLDLTDSFQVYNFNINRLSDLRVEILDTEDNVLRTVIDESDLSPESYSVVLTYEDILALVENGLELKPGADFYIDATITNRASGEESVTRYEGELKDDISSEMLGQVLQHDTLIQRGALSMRREDIQLPGLGPDLTFIRSFSNEAKFGSDSVMGPGWNHNHDIKVSVQVRGDPEGLAGNNLPAWVEENRGMLLLSSDIPQDNEDPTLVYVTNGGMFKRIGNEWFGQRGYHGSLTVVDGAFVYNSKDGTRYQFQPLGFGQDSARVSRIVDLNDNALEYSYFNDGGVERLERVTDASDRELQFTYEELPGRGKRLTAVTTSGDVGITLDFEYYTSDDQSRDDEGMLARFSRSDFDEEYEYGLVDPLDQVPNMVASVDPVGNRTRYYYHPGDSVSPELLAFVKGIARTDIISQIEYPDGEEALIDYDMGGGENKRVVTDLRGNVTTYTLNDFGNPLMVEEPEGRTIEMTWSIDQGIDDNLMTSRTDSLGRLTTYDYDSRGNVIEQVDPIGTTTQTWDLAFSRLLTRQDRNGNTKTFGYDDRGNLVSEEDAEGFVTTHTVNALGQRESSAHPDGGGTSTFTYDDYGNPRLTTLPEGSQTQTFHDARGRLQRRVDPRGLTTRYEYDDLDRLTSTIDRDGEEIAMTYDDKGNKLSESNKIGLTLNYQYDRRDRVETVTRNFGGGSKQFTYDENSNLVSETDWLGQVTTHEYDELNRRTATVNRLQDRMAMTYDLADNLLTETDYENRLTRHFYDDGDRRVRTVNALNDSMLMTYDNENNVLSEQDYEQRLTQYEYDRRYLKTKRTNALGDDYLWQYDGRGNLLQTTDEEQRITTYVYDQQNRLTLSTDAENFPTAYDYDDNGNVTRLTDRRGKITVTTYDSLDRPQDILDGEGYTTSYTYDGEGNKLTESDGNAHVTTYTYDPLSRMRTSLNPVGALTQYTYDANNNVTNRIDPRGMAVRSTYDSLDRLLTETQAFGAPEARTKTLGYDRVGNVVSLQSYRGYTTTTEYDDLNRPTLVTATAPFNYTSATGYDKVGNVMSVRDRLDRTTTTVYDDLNRPVTITDPLSQIVRRSYDAVGNVLTETDKRGTTTTHTYDRQNRLLTSNKPAQGTADIRLVLNEYDGEGLVVAQTDANNNRTTHTYDDRGIKETSTYADASTMVYTLDGVGNVLTEQDEALQVTTNTYDDANRLTSRTNFDNETTQYTYDLNNNKTSEIRPLGNTTTYGYDLLNRLASITDAQAGLTQYTYDGNDNLVRQEDAEQNVVTMRYDELDRKTTHTQVKVGGNLVMTYGYDAMNNRTSMTDPKNQQFTYTYDDLDRETGRTYPADPGNPYIRPTSTTTSYDQNNNPTRISESKVTSTGGIVTDVTTMGYDLLDRETSNTQRGHQISYSYDDNGNRTSVISSGGSTTYDFDNRNRLETASKNGLVSTYSYFADSKLREVTYPNGTRTRYSYDNADRTETVINENVSAATPVVISSYAYEYDDNGNRSLQTEVQNGLAESGVITSYLYDTLDRLTNVTETMGNSDSKTSEYEYDAVFNRIHEIEAVTIGGVADTLKNRTLEYDETNWLTTITEDDSGQTIAYQYDPNGNTLRKVDNTLATPEETRFVYNSRDQLVETARGPPASSTTLGQYDYNFAGLRIRHTESERGDVEYIYDDQAVLEERTLTAAPTAQNDGDLIAHYQYADRLISLTSEADQQFYHYQALRTTSNLTDLNGDVRVSYRTDVWGEITEQAGESENRQVFTGQEHDDRTGLIYFGARFYDPDVGRFINQDTYLGEPGVAPSLHRYLYAYGNPGVYVDPDGHAVETVWDVANVAIGVKSFSDNVEEGNWWSAAIDGVGIVLDSASVLIPGVPGGAGTAIKTARGIDKGIDKGIDAIQNTDKAGDVAQSAKTGHQIVDSARTSKNFPDVNKKLDDAIDNTRNGSQIKSHSKASPSTTVEKWGGAKSGGSRKKDRSDSSGAGKVESDLGVTNKERILNNIRKSKAGNKASGFKKSGVGSVRIKTGGQVQILKQNDRGGNYRSWQNIGSDKLTRLRGEFNSSGRKNFTKEWASSPQAARVLSPRQLKMAKTKGLLPIGWDVHHKKPLSRGGDNQFDNLRVMRSSLHQKLSRKLHNYPVGKNPYGLN